MLGRRADFHEEDEPVREAKPVDLLSRTCLDNTPLVTGKGSQEVLACSFGRRGYVVVPPDKGLNGPGAIADRLPEPLHSRVPTNVLLFWIEGPGWPRRYWQVLADPAFSPAAPRMANLRGIAWWLPWPTAAEIVLAIAVACLLWTFLRRTTDLGLAGAGAAAGGLLLARHGYAGDCALLIPLLVFTVQRPGVAVWLKCWAVLLLTPAPLFLVVLVANKQFYGQLLIVGFVVAALLRECLVKRPTGDPPAQPA